LQQFVVYQVAKESGSSGSKPAALQAGVRTIEHGTYLDDECCDAMRETGAILVPTRTIIEEILTSVTDIRIPARAAAFDHG
jgi:imidazolonepropionase-like amidohydrolase